MDWNRMQNVIGLQGSGRCADALAELRFLSELAANPDESIAVLFGKINSLLFLGRLEEARQCLIEIKKILPHMPTGKPYDLIVVPEQPHLFFTGPSYRYVLDAHRRYFQEHLKP